jgi:hypothetical protein
MTPVLAGSHALVAQLRVASRDQGGAEKPLYTTPALREVPEREDTLFAPVAGGAAWPNTGMTRLEPLRDTSAPTPSLTSSTSTLRNGSSGPAETRSWGSQRARETEAPSTDAKVQAAAALFVLSRQEGPVEEAWVRASEVFRRAFRMLRQTEPRHADLAQVVSDALRFTSPGRFQDLTSAMVPMDRIADALLEPFIPTDVELDVQKKLLAAGWKLTRPYGGRWLSDRS